MISELYKSFLSLTIIMVWVDLHLQTNFADGIIDLESVIEIAMATGLDVISIADRDSLAAQDYIEGEVINLNSSMIIIPGVKITTTKNDILGYGINSGCPELRNLVEKNAKLRDKANLDAVAYLHKITTIPFTPNQYERESVGVGNNIITAMLKYPETRAWLHKHYYGRTTSDLHQELFGPKGMSPISLYLGLPTQEEAITTIHQAGGLAVLASEGTRSLKLKEIAQIKNLDGIEVPTYSISEPEQYEVFAKTLEIMRTYGSGFTGLEREGMMLQRGEHWMPKDEIYYLMQGCMPPKQLEERLKDLR
jgi:predicted metal-dependent phosphoesterase TrpH